MDFWESPYQNGTDISFLVSPDFSRPVKKYLESRHIPAKVNHVTKEFQMCSKYFPFQVLIKNFQSEIDDFEKENNGLCDDMIKTKVNHFMKRSTIWDDIFDFVKTATGPRNPRKVENSPTKNDNLQKSQRGIKFHFLPLPFPMVTSLLPKVSFLQIQIFLSNLPSS